MAVYDQPFCEEGTCQAAKGFLAVGDHEEGKASRRGKEA